MTMNDIFRSALLAVFTLAAIFVLAGAPGGPSAVLAAGDNFGSKDCEEGKVYDSEKDECVDKSASNTHAVEDIYKTALAWSLKGEHAEALEILWLADGREDARILNLLGYSNRMMGRLDVGLAYYRQAISMDPTYTLVRQYYGEGLLQKGDLKGAQDQLAALAVLCGVSDCAAFDDLESAIAVYEAGA